MENDSELSVILIAIGAFVITMFLSIIFIINRFVGFINKVHKRWRKFK